MKFQTFDFPAPGFIQHLIRRTLLPCACSCNEAIGTTDNADIPDFARSAVECGDLTPLSEKTMKITRIF